MYIYICFDVEDLVHPDSDDVPRDIAQMLADDGIVASMYVVGEKARLWERRGRTDVITAVRQHDVGLHTDHHSVHPTVSEYLADKGWADGVAEALRQEEPGVHDLARIFGMYPSTWATSGSSWAPQIPAATRRMGLTSNIYSHARAGQSGACWFAGQLCFSHYPVIPGGEDTYCDDTVFETCLPALLEEIEDARRQGLACVGLFGGHPTRLRYTVFWDSLNFAHGRNTAPADYRHAPRRDDATYATALRNLRRTILAVRDLPGVELTSPRSFSGLFATETGPIAWAEIGELARATLNSESISVENPMASPAQTLDSLARAVVRLSAGSARPPYLAMRTVLGPVEPPRALDFRVSASEGTLLALCHQLVAHVDMTGHLPASLAFDGATTGPGPLLRAAASAFYSLDKGQMPANLTLEPTWHEPAAAADLVEGAIYNRLPNWSPHAPDLRLDQLAMHTRLQSWSLKPAVLRDRGDPSRS
jgi:hypothetical protein